MKKSLGVVPALFPMPVLMIAAYDENGNPVWYCECSVGRKTWHGYHSSKKQGKKSVAYSMLCDILGLEEDDEA